MIKEIIANYFSQNESKSLQIFANNISYMQNTHLIGKIISKESKTLDYSPLEIPDIPQSLDVYSAKLKEYIERTVNVSHPRFIGHMTSRLPNFHRVLSPLITTLNQNLVKLETSQDITFLERQCVAMLHKQIFTFSHEFYRAHQDSESVLGVLVSGGSMANITALWAARNQGLSKGGCCKKQGVQTCLKNLGYKDSVIIASERVHYSIDKFASLSGMGNKNIIKIPVTDDGKMETTTLLKNILQCQKKKLYITAIIAIAGATETGSIDNLKEISAIAKKHRIHFHVDAAWGGPIVFSNKHRSKLAGIEKADSITICGHKQLYLPQGISVLLFKNPRMAHAISTFANYQAREGSFDLGRWSAEGSRPAKVLFLHAALHCLGKKGYEYLIDRSICLSKYMAKRIKQYDCFELLQKPQTNILVYRYLPKKLNLNQNHLNILNKNIQKQQFYNGNAFVSNTTLSIKKYKNTAITALRVVLANPNTTKEDIDYVLQEQIDIAQLILENAQTCKEK